MNEDCNFCRVCCKLIPIDLERNIICRDGIQPADLFSSDNLTQLTIEQAKDINQDYVEKVLDLFPNIIFFSCKKIDKCTFKTCHPYCKNFPSEPVAIIPDECSYYGEFFLKNEITKQKIRKIKEEMVHYEALIRSSKNNSEKDSYKKILHNLQKFVDKYAEFGSKDW